MKKVNTDQYAFEIAFYERLIKSNPHFIDVLTPLADAYTKVGEYQKGLKIDKKLAKLRKNDENVFYNLACSYALNRMPDEAFQALRKAISLGYTDFRHMRRDPDLNNIKADKRFKTLIESLKKDKSGIK